MEKKVENLMAAIHEVVKDDSMPWGDKAELITMAALANSDFDEFLSWFPESSK